MTMYQSEQEKQALSDLHDEHLVPLAQIMVMIEREGVEFIEQPHIKEAYSAWRTTYADALAKVFDDYQAPARRKLGDDEESIANARYFYIDDAVEADLAGLVRHYHRERNLSPDVEAERTRIMSMHLGTYENIYCRERDAAEEQTTQWVKTIQGKPRGGRSIAGDDTKDE